MHILVPVKNTAQAKSRLADLLSPDQRRALTLTMLRDVLAALTRSSVVKQSNIPIHLVSDDPLVKEIACAFDARFIEDLGSGDLNAALSCAAESLNGQGITTLWVLPADLPRVTPGDIDALLAQHGGGPAMTIAPAERDLGTNALGLSPPNLMDFSFGRKSFERHCAAAQAQGAPPSIIRRSGLTFDLDTPQDLFTFAGEQSSTLTGKLIANWRLEF